MKNTLVNEAKTQNEVQDNIDQAVEDTLNFDLSTFDEIKKAFEK